MNTLIYYLAVLLSLPSIALEFYSAGFGVDRVDKFSVNGLGCHGNIRKLLYGQIVLYIKEDAERSSERNVSVSAVCL